MSRIKNNPARSSRPILRKAVPRERLFEQLDRFQDGPVIWVSGPAGSGKTTLVSSYLQDRRIPNLWYQVAEADKDPATFFYRMGSFFTDAFPRRKKTLPLLNPEYLQASPPLPGVFSRRPSALETGDGSGFRQFPVHSGEFDNPTGRPAGGGEFAQGRAPGADQPGRPAFILDQAPGESAIGPVDLGRPAPDLGRIGGDRPIATRSEVPGETIRQVHTLVDGWAAGLMRYFKASDRGSFPKKSMIPPGWESSNILERRFSIEPARRRGIFSSGRLSCLK